MIFSFLTEYPVLRGNASDYGWKKRYCRQKAHKAGNHSLLWSNGLHRLAVSNVVGRDLHSIGVRPQFSPFSSSSSALWSSSRVCGCQTDCGSFSCAQLWDYNGSDEPSSVRTHSQVQRNHTDTACWCYLDTQMVTLW